VTLAKVEDLNANAIAAGGTDTEVQCEPLKASPASDPAGNPADNPVALFD